ncbi:MAG: shikimate dehydrogenase [Gemmatimonadetes bacterium]|nr:shikimate dehydrogenase [Gemmatimonadota bacterium]
MSPISSTTRVLTLLGDPISHSLSPTIQNAAFEAAGVDGVYVAVRCDRERLPALMEAMAQSGGGGNVTLPHKERAAAVVKHPSEAVRRTGACNTFWGEKGEIRGDNTDVEGFRRALERFLGRPPRDHRVLVLGAGGAARAVLLALLDEGVKDITLFNRTVERARAVSRRIGGERVRVVSPVDELNGGQFDLVVNSTRLGLDPADPLPLDLTRLERVGAVLDLVYGDHTTGFVEEARRYGVPATDGGEMLVQQGAVSFERWWGKEAPVEAMRAALEARRGIT